MGTAFILRLKKRYCAAVKSQSQAEKLDKLFFFCHREGGKK